MSGRRVWGRNSAGTLGGVLIAIGAFASGAQAAPPATPSDAPTAAAAKPPDAPVTNASSARDAAPVQAALVWAGGLETCLHDRALARSVEAHLHRAAFVAPDAADLELAITVAQPASGNLHVTVQILVGDTEVGVRELDGTVARCGALAETLALVIAMLVDVPRSALPRRAQPDLAPPSPLAPHAVRQAEDEHDGHVAPPRSARPRWSAHAFGGALAGTAPLPAPSLGVLLGMRLDPPAPSAVLVAASLWPGATVTRGAGDVSFTAASVSVGAAPAIFRAPSSVAWRAASVIELGVVRGDSRGFAVNHASAQHVVSIGLGFGPELELGAGFSAFVTLGAALGLARPRFTLLDDGGQPHALLEVPFLSARAAAALAASLF